MKKSIALLAAAVFSLSIVACTDDTESTTATTASVDRAQTASPATTSDTATRAPESNGTPITLTAGDTVITASLNDTQVSQDFLAQLPVTLEWKRNAGIEYITELSAPLTETGPFYTDVQPGDLVYYNPLDSITIIYEETVSVPTLTYMGKITSDLGEFRDLPDDVEFRIARG